MSERYRGTVRAPEFPNGLQWLNVGRPLTLQSLRGKVVVLDFWTFCCINCQHVLPALKELEERFPPEELVVVGVHCGKFPAEADLFNLRQAVLRHDVRHPVVNDPNFVIWRSYAVRAWPTVAIVDVDGRVLGMHSGEFEAEPLADLIHRLLEDARARGELNSTPVDLLLETTRLPETNLLFPGKVLADGERLFIADTGHHQIVEAEAVSGKVRRRFGCGEPGLLDGSALRARFRFPQGMALVGESLYVADTENHAVRRINLDTGTVTTVAGTGAQARPEPLPGPGREAALNSPWDLAVDGDDIYIAMAGSHQLWRIDRNSHQLEPFAGDGGEALQDGPRLSARLAQPSGLAILNGRLWFVDSETSSLRSTPLRSAPGTPEVRTSIGEGLFEFGDQDGTRPLARLQHPLGLCVLDGMLVIADSYNHRLKKFDPKNERVSRWLGCGEAGPDDGVGDDVSFWEPGGVSVSGKHLYVADTNNHLIRVVDLAAEELSVGTLRVG